MATQESIEKAAQAWCKPTTDHLIVEPNLALVFAVMLDEQQAHIRNLQLHYDKLRAHVKELKMEKFIEAAEAAQEDTDGSLKAQPTRTQDITLNLTCAGKGKSVLQSGDEEDIEDGER